jgi:hypothetical protein
VLDGAFQCPRASNAGEVGATGYNTPTSCCEARLVGESRKITEPTFLNYFKLRPEGEDGLASVLEPGPGPCPGPQPCSALCPASSSSTSGDREGEPLPQPVGSGEPVDNRTSITSTLRHNQHHDVLTWNSKGCKREVVLLCPAVAVASSSSSSTSGDFREGELPQPAGSGEPVDLTPFGPLNCEGDAASLASARSGNYFLLTAEETAALMHESPRGMGFDPFDESELEFMHIFEGS